VEQSSDPIESATQPDVWEPLGANAGQSFGANKPRRVDASDSRPPVPKFGDYLAAASSGSRPILDHPSVPAVSAAVRSVPDVLDYKSSAATTYLPPSRSVSIAFSKDVDRELTKGGDATDETGFEGEEYVAKTFLPQMLAEKFPNRIKFEKEDEIGFPVLIDGKRAFYIVWMNGRKESGEPYDILLKNARGGENERKKRKKKKKKETKKKDAPHQLSKIFWK
jgi:hypothetical protein